MALRLMKKSVELQQKAGSLTGAGS